MRSCLRKDNQVISQIILTSVNQGNILLLSVLFYFEKSHELIAIAMAMHSMPFKFVDYKCFRAYFQYIHYGLPTCSRNSIKDGMLKLYESEIRKIKDLLVRTPGRISLTSDM